VATLGCEAYKVAVNLSSVLPSPEAESDTDIGKEIVCWVPVICGAGPPLYRDGVYHGASLAIVGFEYQDEVEKTLNYLDVTLQKLQLKSDSILLVGCDHSPWPPGSGISERKVQLEKIAELYPNYWVESKEDTSRESLIEEMLKLKQVFLFRRKATLLTIWIFGAILGKDLARVLGKLVFSAPKAIWRPLLTCKIKAVKFDE
jgi:hypothetical protein